jgi:hypothetical protein
MNARPRNINVLPGSPFDRLRANVLIDLFVIHDTFFSSPSVPLPEGEGGIKPFSLREKGGDEGSAFA